MRSGFACALAALLVIVGLTSALAQTESIATALPTAESGIASVYSSDLEDQLTASGQRYDGSRLTAAHRTLPLGTRIRVTDPASGRAVTVRINDRGPFLKGRILDLSYAAARALGASTPGVIRVRLEVIGKAPGKKPAAGGGAKGRPT